MKILQVFCLAGVIAAALEAGPVGPGSLIAVLANVNDSDPGLSSTPAQYTVTLNASPQLFPDTYYWIGLSATGSTSAAWSFDNDASGDNGPLGNDTTPAESYVFAGTMFPDTSGPFQMSVTEAGAVVFDNTSESSDPGPSAIDPSQGLSPLYDSFFTTGAAGDITNLQLILSAADDSGSFQVGLYADTPADTPEPASSLLVAAGAGVLGLLRRAANRRTRQLA